MSEMFDGSLSSMFGLRMISDPKLVEDSGKRSWSRVRSPGRARRRLKRGFRQNIDVIWIPSERIYQTGDSIIAHPIQIARIVAAIKEQQQ